MKDNGKDPLLWNKIAGGALVGLLLIMVSGYIGNWAYHVDRQGDDGFPIEVAEADTDAGTMDAAPKEIVIEPIIGLLASADSAKGEKLSKKCAACHSFDQGGAKKVGPNLWGVVGAAKASKDGFGYSNALKEMAGVWDFDTLNKFIANPKAYAPGTTMGYAGLKSAEDRANLLFWLNQQSPTPLPLP